ncbi:alcohol dehydrogenase IV [Myxozyma melibiosi]|uniref:Alcohol dehydrogenase IV n=1 Tax=Myxozyma melibiosi TaxID=54550 RepID=A0ABR1F9I9_9ASCO
MPAATTSSPPAAAYRPSAALKVVEHGSGSLAKLPEVLKLLNVTKPFIVTGQSVRERTPIIDNVLGILGRDDVVVFSAIKQHAPIADIRDALRIFKESGSDGILAIGGGSPVDSGKIIAYHLLEQSSTKIPLIAVPTTFSVAETTPAAGYTNEEGHKTTVLDPTIAPEAIIYDAEVLQYTPLRLLLSSGIRAVDHAVETLYATNISEVPFKPLALSALSDLFKYLPLLKEDPKNTEIGQMLFNAAFLSLFPRYTLEGGLGLSHRLGHALGAKYGIPHGITSCATLAASVNYKATSDPYAAAQLQRAIPFLGLDQASDAETRGRAVAAAIARLVDTLGLTTKLGEYSVPVADVPKIALHAVGGDPESPEYGAVQELVRSLY